MITVYNERPPQETFIDLASAGVFSATMLLARARDEINNVLLSACQLIKAFVMKVLWEGQTRACLELIIIVYHLIWS